MRLAKPFRHLLPVLAAASLAAAAPRTLRVDWYHTGGKGEERFSQDRVVVEPLPWPGNPDRAVDDTELGKYAFEVRDAATKKVLYSRGFASIYGEWETTDEAKAVQRTFSESLRFPAPEAPVEVTVKKRDAKNAFAPVWTFSLDPKAQDVDPSLPAAPGKLLALEQHGDPAHKVDFLILGDGYTAAERPKFEKDARRLMELLFAQEPFKSHRKDFNVWALCPAARESGISRPSLGVHKRSPLGATYDAFGSERYVLTFENRAFRDVAAFAPYEFVEVLVNGKIYGGGGIHNLFGTVAADNLWSPYVFVHEFGHHFAGLADEYYTSDVAVTNPEAKVEPWEPNVTALLPGRPLKWAASEGTPVPTPWKKAEFEAYSHGVQKRRRAIRAGKRPESEMDALFTEERGVETKLLGTDAFSGKVGAFEGANYESTGYYRSQEDCIMFTRDQVGFCAACRAAISKVIDLYVSTSGR